MAEHIITTTDSEEAALAWQASHSTSTITPPVPPPSPEVYLDSAVHEMLGVWERNHAIATTVAPVDVVATAYVKGTAEQQQQVNDILGVPPTTP
jgi:hypothetical protein